MAAGVWLSRHVWLVDGKAHLGSLGPARSRKSLSRLPGGNSDASLWTSSRDAALESQRVKVRPGAQARSRAGTVSTAPQVGNMDKVAGFAQRFAKDPRGEIGTAAFVLAVVFAGAQGNNN